jgi:soluble lytic murein transglycosylase-like protein
MLPLIPMVILNSAIQNDVKPELLGALCYHESKFKNVKVLDKKSYSYGYCQIKHIAAKDVGFNGKSQELKDLQVSTKYAAKFLKKGIKKCGNIEKGIVYYNTGKCVKNVKNNKYLKAVLGYYNIYKNSFLISEN